MLINCFIRSGLVLTLKIEKLSQQQTTKLVPYQIKRAVVQLKINFTRMDMTKNITDRAEFSCMNIKQFI